MNELMEWLNTNKITFHQIDNEVIEIDGFGKMLLADLSGVASIFKGEENNLRFNLMESPDVLMSEEIFYVAFEFGRNWYYYDLREPFRFNILKYIGNRQPTKLNIPFVNLGIHTPYELLNGSGDLSQWVQKAKYLGHTAIGICDYNTMGATLNLQKECAKAEIKHIFGYSFTLEHKDEKIDMKIYCQSQKGLRNMLRVQKAVMVDSAIHVLSFLQLLTYAEGNILVFGKRSSYWLKQNPQLVDKLTQAFSRVFYQVDLSEYKAERIDVEVLQSIAYYFENFYDSVTHSFAIEPILICDNYYLDQDDARNKIVLNKIASGAAHEQSDQQYFKDIDEHFATIEPLFDSEKWNVKELFERMCRHTVEVAQSAEANYELGKMYMPEYIMLPKEIEEYGTRHTMFLTLLEEGLNAKIPKENHSQYRKRLKEEIYIIESTNNVDYFLVQWDMIREAHRRGIITGVARGSAGGSLVSYLLDIISIDPIKYDLIFSRFLVPERCGLSWVDEVSIIDDRMTIDTGGEYVELKIDGKDYRFDKDAQLIIHRGDSQMKVYADELQEGDDILFDRKNVIWTLNESTQ